MKIRLNEKTVVQIDPVYKKGDKLYCTQIKCELKENFKGCRFCNIHRIQENNSQRNYMWVRYEDIKHLLID